jgi:diguanylate cyclase (GGDEF)-like protein
MVRWTWRQTTVLGGVALAGLLAVPDGRGKQLLWLAVSLVAFAATVIGPRRHPPVRHHQGWLLSLAMGGFVVTNLLSVLAYGWPADHPVQLVSSLLFPASYLLIGAAMLRLVAARTPGGDPDGRIDGLLVLIATGTVLFDLIAAPGVAGSADAVERTIFAALPLVQAPVIAATVRLLITGSHRHPTAWAFLVAACGGLVGNVLFVLGVGDPWLLLAWFTAYLGVAVGTLHPSYAELSGPAPDAAERLALGRLAVIGLALLALPAVMFLGREGGLGSSVPALAAAICVVLVLWRIARLVRDREQAALELRHRADRETALSALGHAAVTDLGVTAFLEEVRCTVARTLDVDAELAPHRAARLARPDGAAELRVSLGPDEDDLVAVFPATHPPSAEDDRFVRTAADLAAAAVRRWRVEDELRHRSLHDVLTGLPNRTLVLDRLEAALARGARAGHTVAVLFLDLDGFKAINDTCGHAAGDELLIGVGRRLRETARLGDTVGRLAGDEFVVICDDAPGPEAFALAERLVAVLDQPYELSGGTSRVGASIGIATARHHTDPEGLLRDADGAMYRAKRSGTTRVAAADAERPAPEPSDAAAVGPSTGPPVAAGRP